MTQEELARYTELAIKSAQRENWLLKLAFEAMHAQLPDSIMAGWFYDPDEHVFCIALHGGHSIVEVPHGFKLGKKLPEVPIASALEEDGDIVKRFRLSEEDRDCFLH